MSRRLLPLFLLVFLLAPMRLLAQQDDQCGATQPRVPEPTTSEEEAQGNPSRMVARQAAMLLKGDFESIDFLANRLRSQKTHLPNGNWALTRFYSELNPPRAEAGSPRYLKQLNDWVAANPTSITARIALANFYHQWAEDARGTGFSCTVSPQQWKQYQERAAKSHQILDDAASFQPMDPEWFSAMQTVAYAEEWSPKKARDLFDRAVAFAPDYFPFYNSYTRYLLPKWFGKPGEPEAFAKSAADHAATALGPDMGDVLYFQMVYTILHGGRDQFDLKRIDWPRVQRGYAAHIQRYGDAPTHDSEFAFMAWQANDVKAASQVFHLLGNQPNATIWKSRARFQQVRNWALNDGPYPSPGNPTARISPTVPPASPHPASPNYAPN